MQTSANASWILATHTSANARYRNKRKRSICKQARTLSRTTCRYKRARTLHRWLLFMQARTLDIETSGSAPSIQTSASASSMVVIYTSANARYGNKRKRSICKLLRIQARTLDRETSASAPYVYSGIAATQTSTNLSGFKFHVDLYWII